MKTKIFLALAASWGLAPQRLGADNRIILYLSHAPQQVLQSVESEVLSKRQPAQGLARPALNGIAALYGGYFNISASDGLISFPLRHTAQKVYLAITPSIQLVHAKSNTISHRTYEADAIPTAIYSCELKKDDKNRWFWAVKKEAMPSDRVINPLTVVLLTPPSNIFIPEGEFLANENQQLVLPNAMLLSRQGNEASILKAMDIRPYFEGISMEKKKNNDTSTQQMIKNI
jgi:hypothetical protein